MGWESDDGRHEGWDAAVFADGRLSVGAGGGARVRTFAPGPLRGQHIGDPETVDGRTAIGWRGLCECGWRGPLWERVATPAEHNPAARRVHDPDPSLYGFSPAEVEEAIRREWRAHLEPDLLDVVRAEAAAATLAAARLTTAVCAARRAGRSWSDIGSAVGTSRQAAHERWSQACSATTRTVLVPDQHDDLLAVLEGAEELLLTFASREDDGDVAPGELPNALSGRTALEALRRIGAVVRRTQGRHAVEAGRTGRLPAPGGTYEHVPLRLAHVESADVDALAAAARALGVPHPSERVEEALSQTGTTVPGPQVVVRLVRLVELLALAETAETALLRERLADADPAADIVLTSEEEAAYQHLADRFTAMWSLSSPLARFVY